MELKYERSDVLEDTILSSNRTFMELKLGCTSEGIAASWF